MEKQFQELACEHSPLRPGKGGSCLVLASEIVLTSGEIESSSEHGKLNSDLKLHEG